MSKPEFTVLLPVHRPPDLLPYAIESVLAQERRDFELFIICDGAPESTARCAREAAQRDGRIRVHVHPKGERHGEAYRHQALERAEGRYVCQIADDDLWFPNHLSEMAQLLREVEFGNLLHVLVVKDSFLHAELADLALEATRALMRDGPYNFFGPTETGYRLETYRRLPDGWTPAPPDLWTDLHMWRKFLALPGISVGTRVAVTAIRFPAEPRRDWPPEKRVAETRHWARFVQDAHNRDRIAQGVLLQMLRGELERRTSNRTRATRISKLPG